MRILREIENMASRRMFSKTVVNSGRFLNMSVGARLLYYDLGMAADDDGVVESLFVLRVTEATEADLHELVDNQFVIILNDDLVCYINDWLKNNQIRQDRYTCSVYTELLKKTLGESFQPYQEKRGNKRKNG